MTSPTRAATPESTEDGCAVGDNGELKNAEDIQWYDSADDAEPKLSSEAKQRSPRARPVSPIARARRTVKKTWKAQGADPLAPQTKKASFFAPRPSSATKASSASPSKSAAASPRASPCIVIETSDVETSEDDDMPDSEALFGKHMQQRKSTHKKNVLKRKRKRATETSDSEGSTVHQKATRRKAKKYRVDSGSDRDDEDNEKYFKVRKEAQSERKKNVRCNDERTADIRAFYKAETRLIKGEAVEGHWCLICQKRPGATKGDSWFSGNTSTLRTHIKRKWTTHGPVYLAGCKRVGIKPNHRAVPQERDDARPEKHNTGQGSLDGFVARQSRWTKDGLLEHIIELFVTEDLPFNVIDKGPFRRLLKFQRPTMKESDIPHRTKLREAIMKKAKEVEGALRDQFKDLPCQISITFDAWTSSSYDPYLAITAHYVDKQPTAGDWSMKARLIGFTEIEGNHGGENTADIIMRVIDRAGIRDKLGWATSDNATTNDACMRALERVLDDHSWKAKDRRVRCFEHVLHLAGKAFIESIGPTHGQSRKPTTTNPGADTPSEDEDIDEDNAEIDEEWFYELMDVAEDVDADLFDFEPGDVLGKLLALINQIRASPQARKYFATVCSEEGIKPLQLIKWIRTRWGSMHDLVRRALDTKPAVNKFCRLADDCGKVPSLKNKNYSDYFLHKKEWELLELICEVLQEIRGAQASFSSEKRPSVWCTVPMMECLQERWETMARAPRFKPIQHAIQAALKKLRKYYIAMDTSSVYFICLALDPGIKSEYAKSHWEVKYYEKGLSAFRRVFNTYVVKQADMSASTSIEEPLSASASQDTVASDDTYQRHQGYGSSWMQATLRSRFAEEADAYDPHQEITNYLSAPLEKLGSDNDVVGWWSKQSQKYPVLSLLARDYLAIQGSSVASERAFSSGGRTGTALRNRLKPETFEALQLLKDAYRTGLISASSAMEAQAVGVLY